MTFLYQNLPSITEVDSFLESKKLPSGKEARSCANAVLQEARLAIQNLQSESLPPLSNTEWFTDRTQVMKRIAERVLEQNLYSKSSSISKVINATGIVIHTNLGRAPLPPDALDALNTTLSSYATVEYDLKHGTRGLRGQQVIDLLKMLSGAEDALVVNNNAASVFLMLRALTAGKEVLVSRGELVEIGGSFRIPDIMREAGATLVEVGTTNRTRISDYANAITNNTVALLKVHPSNYVIQGFVEEVSTRELTALAEQKGLMTFHDLGSASFYRFQNPALQHLPTIQQEIAHGVDLLCFSADKLLGSTQAGILLGQKKLIQHLKKHPLYRALRLGKSTLCLLESTLEKYRNPQSLLQEIPVITLLEQSAESIYKKASLFFEEIKKLPSFSEHSELRSTTSLAGGGALPELHLESWGIVLKHTQHSAQNLCDLLRTQTLASQEQSNILPVIGRIFKNEFWLDFRTILDPELPFLLKAIALLELQLVSKA